MNPRIKNVPLGWRKSKVGSELSIENQLREPISSGDRAQMTGPLSLLRTNKGSRLS